MLAGCNSCASDTNFSLKWKETRGRRLICLCLRKAFLFHILWSLMMMSWGFFLREEENSLSVRVMGLLNLDGEKEWQKHILLTTVSQECKDSLAITSFPPHPVQVCGAGSWMWWRRGNCSGQPSSATLSSPWWQRWAGLPGRFSWCTAQCSGVEQQWCAPAKHTIQASWELPSSFWSCSCRNLWRTPEGECCLPGVTPLLLLYSIHAGSSWVNNLQVWGFLWHAWPNLMCRLQFEVSRVLKNEMFLKVKLQSFIWKCLR